MNFVLWFAQNLQIGPVSEYTRYLWIMLVEKNVKGGEAGIILSCQDDDFCDKFPLIYCVNL
jgi:hypothetical protein